MQLKSLRATFGRLDGETLDLHPGLNVIEAPNESGKSTWAAFLRSMLYGVPTSDRERSGYLPDKTRFRPWNGKPMSGSMDLIWDGKAITLRRTSTGGGRPMGSADAVYTDTGERVTELLSGEPGEILIGAAEPVFRRSAFISGSDLAVDMSGELEKRITSLVTAGEERSSYTEADERLRRWLRKRRFRSSGRLPEAEKEREQLRRALKNMEEENRSLAELRAEEKQLGDQILLLENELKLHRRDERRAERERLEQARQTLTRAETAAAEARADWERLKTESGNYTDADVAALRAAAAASAEAERHREAAERTAAEKMTAVRRLPKAGKKPNPNAKIIKVLYVLGTLDLLATIVLGLSSNGAGPAVFACLAAGFLLLIAASILMFKGRSLALAAEEADRETAAAAKTAAEEAEREAETERETARAARETLNAALRAVGAPEKADPEEAASVAELCLRELRDARLRAESAEDAVRNLRELAELPIPEPEENDSLEGETRIGREAAEDYLGRTRQRLKLVTRELNRGEARFELLGDPLVLASEESRLTEEIGRLGEEAAAIELAGDALREANLQLQTLFSPLVSRLAASYMARMTGERYSGVYFNREMHFSAQTSGETEPHALEYLSEGTRSQLYLAVRLAISELVFPEDNPCPLILDDALLSFDDARAKETLRLLKELSGKRQILLFTCQSRERQLLKQLEEEETCRQP